MLAIPSSSHLLEASAAETAFDVGALVGITAFLICGWGNPGLLNLVVVRKIHLPPAAVVQVGGFAAFDISCMEFPSEIKQFAASLRQGWQRHGKQHDGQK